MSSPLSVGLEATVRSHLEKTIEADDRHTAEDILRCYREQASLLFETVKLRTALTTDPFEHLVEVKQGLTRLIKLLHVTEFQTITTLDGYSRIEATVSFRADATMKPVVESLVELKFRYERTSSNTSQEPVGVSYSIDLAKDHGAAERMLWVNVQAIGNFPSSTKAANMTDDEQARWSDMESDDEESKGDAVTSRDVKKNMAEIRADASKTRSSTVAHEETTTTKGEGPGSDVFTAGIDGDLLTTFLEWAQVGPMDDITAFFLLMTFQYYELEWDIIGYLLEAVFGSDDDSMDSVCPHE